MVQNHRRNAALTQTAILDAAEQLFVQLGPSDVSIRDIAQSCGVTSSVLYHHFGSKDDLWQACKARCLRPYFDAQLTLLESSSDDLDVLQNALITFFDFLENNPNAVRLTAWTALQDDLNEEGDMSILAPSIQRLEQAQQAGLIRADVQAINVFIMMHACAVHWHQNQRLYQGWTQGRHSAELNTLYRDDFIAIILRGLQPPATTGDYRG